jgi:hypothetical protein
LEICSSGHYATISAGIVVKEGDKLTGSGVCPVMEFGISSI